MQGIHPKTNLGGNPLILGRPWLATADAYIGCRSRSMIIAHGDERKHVTLYPSDQYPFLLSWLDEEEPQELQYVLSLNQVYNFREEEENEDLLDLFISKPDILEHIRITQYEAASHILNQHF